MGAPSQRWPLAALCLLAASALAAAAPGSDASACGLDCSSVFIADLFRACLLNVSSAAVFPDTDLEAWDKARRTFNARTLRAPAAVFYANSTEDVAAAVKCAAAYGVRVSPAAGRQGFQGGAVQDGFLVVDVSALTQTSLGPDNKTFTVGAGSSNVMTMTALHAQAGPGVGITTGVGSFVGTAGFNLGGGFGLFGRYLGLGCDSVVGLEMVLADGRIVQVDADNEPDLLWASCGGGGGTLGIITKFTYRLTPLPNGGRLSTVAIDYARGVDNAVAQFMAFQKALPTLDKRFGFAYGLNQAKFNLFGLFLGEPSEALQLLRQAGMLEGLDPEKKVGPAESDTAGEQPIGLVLKAWPSYWEWSLNMNTPTWMFTAPWGPASNFTFTRENIELVASAQSGEDRIIGGVDGYSAWYYSQSRLVGIMPEEAVRGIAEYGADAVGKACQESKGLDVACLMGIGGHVLGGAYSDRAADATAYPHRDSFFVLDATVTVPTSVRDLIPPEAIQLLARPSELVNGFLSVLKKHSLGGAAYANYQPDALASFEAAYWAGNAPRLAAIKARYDPLGLFSKPGTMQGVLASSGAGPAAVPTPAPAPLVAASSATGPRRTLAGAALAMLAAAAALLM